MIWLKCEICTSPHRNEIERMYFEGYSPKQIAAYIENTYGIRYSPKTIQTHLEKHLTPDKAIQNVTEVDAALTAAENLVKKLNERDELYDIIEDARVLRKQAKDKILRATELKEIDVWSRVWNVATQRSIQAIKTVIEKTAHSELQENVAAILKEMWGADENN